MAPTMETTVHTASPGHLESRTGFRWLSTGPFKRDLCSIFQIAQVPVNLILTNLKNIMLNERFIRKGYIPYAMVPFIEGSRRKKTDAGERNLNNAVWGFWGDTVRVCGWWGSGSWGVLANTHQRHLGVSFFVSFFLKLK